MDSRQQQEAAEQISTAILKLVETMTKAPRPRWDQLPHCSRCDDVGVVDGPPEEALGRVYQTVQPCPACPRGDRKVAA